MTKKSTSEDKKIRFSEIPRANKGGHGQDRFEIFACDFLETIGYNIISRPNRGPDGGRDFIVSDTKIGKVSNKIIKYLVSCKHFTSGKSVGSHDEIDIVGRLRQHKCKGFIGVYSTIESSPLSNKLIGIEHIIYNGGLIEQEILKCKAKDRDRLLVTYFPDSFEKFHQKISILQSIKKKSYSTKLNEDDVFRITRTAMVLLEIDKLRAEYSSEWEDENTLLSKIYRFSQYTNEKIADSVFDILDLIAYGTRSGMPDDIASSIFSSILSFFPSSYTEPRKVRTELGKRCIHIGFSIAYDAFIYLNDIKVAEWGLNILKFIYREAKRKKMIELMKEVHNEYASLESTLKRPERNDLQNAKDLVKVFKDDLETNDLSFPVLPPHLHKLKWG